MTCPEVRAGMRRRAASSGKVAKQGRRKSGKSRAARVPAPRLAELEKQLSEALRQRAATSEVLEIISSSEREPKPVFQAILKNAVRLCEAKFGNLLLIDGQTARWAAGVGTPPKLARYLQSPSYRPTPGSHLDRVMRTGQVSYSADDTTEPVVGASARLGGARSSVCVPMIKDKTLVGAIFVYRTEMRPFTDDQINLVKSFAAQAVIALQNARLFNETKEALERQTATAEVLQVINSSPGDLAPVFDAILRRAHSLCGVTHGALELYDGQNFRAVAMHGLADSFADQLRQGYPASDNPATRPLIEGQPFSQILDVTQHEFPFARDRGSARTLLCVPLRRDDKLLGMIACAPGEMRPFTDKQIALLQNFAAQAVIAMENARLLGELHQRTDEVAELNRGLEARVAEQVEELGRVGRLKRFLAPQLAELIVSQGDEQILESHRREIVVVFCDLRGYTAFTETAEPEEVLAFLREYHGALGPLVSQFEGTLDPFSGDGIMVFFNDP